MAQTQSPGRSAGYLQNRNTKTLFDASLYSTPQGEPMEVGRDESEELFQDSQYESVQRSFQTPKSSKLTNAKCLEINKSQNSEYSGDSSQSNEEEETSGGQSQSGEEEESKETSESNKTSNGKGKVTSTFQSIKDEEEKSERKFNEELMSNSRYSTDDEGNSTAETVEPNTSKSLLEMSDSDLESSIQSAENSINRTGETVLSIRNEKNTVEQSNEASKFSKPVVIEAELGNKEVLVTSNDESNSDAENVVENVEADDVENVENAVEEADVLENIVEEAQKVENIHAVQDQVPNDDSTEDEEVSSLDTAIDLYSSQNASNATGGSDEIEPRKRRKKSHPEPLPMKVSKTIEQPHTAKEDSASSSDDETANIPLQQRQNKKKIVVRKNRKETKFDREVLSQMDNPKPSTSGPLVREQERNKNNLEKASGDETPLSRTVDTRRNRVLRGSSQEAESGADIPNDEVDEKLTASEDDLSDVVDEESAPTNEVSRMTRSMRNTTLGAARLISPNKTLGAVTIKPVPRGKSKARAKTPPVRSQVKLVAPVKSKAKEPPSSSTSGGRSKAAAFKFQVETVSSKPNGTISFIVTASPTEPRGKSKGRSAVETPSVATPKPAAETKGKKNTLASPPKPRGRSKARPQQKDEPETVAVVESYRGRSKSKKNGGPEAPAKLLVKGSHAKSKAQTDVTTVAASDVTEPAQGGSQSKPVATVAKKATKQAAPEPNNEDGLRRSKRTRKQYRYSTNTWK